MYEQLVIAGASLVGLMVVSRAALEGWRGWLELKTRELDRVRETPPGSPEGMARIEVADLKERVRKLEAIAAGVDL